MPIPGTMIWLTLGWIAQFDVSPGLALLWSLSGAGVFLARSLLLRAMVPPLEQDWQLARASRVVTVCGAMLGCLAAVGAFAVFPHLSAERQALLTMVYMGWFAGGVGVNGTFPRWFYVWALPLMVSLILAWLLLAHATAVAIASLLAMLSLMLLSTLRDYSRQIVRSLNLQSELAQRTEQLEHALAMKASFMAATSHDLRQPVTSLGLLNFALQQTTDHAASRAIAQKMTTPIEALRSMLNALMEISQLESNAMTVLPSEFSIADSCQKLADEYREQLADRPIALRLIGEDYLVHTDRNMVERIVRNLLSNAVKYTAQGVITLSYTVTGNQLRIKVTDTGVGICAQDQQRVFGDYFQVDNPSRSRDKGLGLGLAIVKRISQLLHGSIELDSEPGKGSTFCLTLPISSARLIDSPLVKPADTSVNPQSLTQRVIMIVDDDRLVRESMATLLTLNGATVFSFEHAEQALLDLAQSNQLPDLALIDYQLCGERNGIDLLNLLRLQHPTMQGILLTGNTDPALVGDVERAGARLLHKPVRPERLLKLIASVGERSSRNDATATSNLEFNP